MSNANNAEWAAALEGVKSPDRMTAIGDEMRPTYTRAIDYDNDQLKTETMPSFREMLSLFKDKLSLVEESTRVHYPALVEFVEVWNRALADAIPRAVPEQIGHGEEMLQGLYDDAERYRAELVAELRGKAR